MIIYVIRKTSIALEKSKSEYSFITAKLRVYLMWRIMIDPKLCGSGKIHATVIKNAAMKIKYKSKQKYYHNYSETVEYGGSRIFLVYQFHENDILYIKQARYARR